MEKSHTHDLAKVAKGFGNHWRIEIMDFLDAHSGISLSAMAEHLDINLKTLSVHVQRMKNTGIVYAWTTGITVSHRLSARGKTILTFLRKLE